MKRVLSVLLCLAIMLIGMATAMATNEISGSSTGVGSSTVTMTATQADPTYVLKIPQTINLGSLTRTEESDIQSTDFTVTMVSMENFFDSYTSVDLSVSGSGANGAFELKQANGDKTVPYKVYMGVETIAIDPGELLFSICGVGEQLGRIELDTKDIPAAGTYNGTMTFTAKIK
ncbi:MAG: hypothetical protein E7328_00020 [Clostridiales bacterium]|nr:hypothetical protein [Clostridiales bacterium]